MSKLIYVVTALDHPDSTEKRAHLRPEHLRWIETCQDAFMMAGPLRDHEDGPVIGSLLLMKADNEDAVQTLLNDDPYAKNGLFASVTIRHFQPVTGAWLT